MKKKKAGKVIVGVLLTIFLIISGAYAFHTFYFETIFVSGHSMSPTLVQEGNITDFGIIDKHQHALKNIKRFDIVSTYYPDDYVSDGILKNSATKKIKRVIALPNETFKIENGYLYVLQNEHFKLIEYSFETTPNVNENYDGKDIEATTLQDNEYWLLGDNRANSLDCGSLNKAIKYQYLYGVLVAIEGKAEIYTKHYVCVSCNHIYSIDKENDVCLNCSDELKVVYGIKNRQYHWPRFF